MPQEPKQAPWCRRLCSRTQERGPRAACSTCHLGGGHHAWNTHPSHLPSTLPRCETKHINKFRQLIAWSWGSRVFISHSLAPCLLAPFGQGVVRRSSPAAPQEPVKTAHSPGGGRRPQGLCWGSSLCLEDPTNSARCQPRLSGGTGMGQIPVCCRWGMGRERQELPAHILFYGVFSKMT